MKRLNLFWPSFVGLCLIFCAVPTVQAGSIGSDCSLKGKKLQGKVKVIKSFADFKVQKVQSFPDLKVKMVSNFPNDCGVWKIVNSFPDFTVEYVDHFPDFKIKVVSHFPGL